MTFVFDDFNDTLKNEVMNTIPNWMMKETKSELWEEIDDAERELNCGFDNISFFMIQLSYVMLKKYGVEHHMTFSAINFLRFKDAWIPQEFLPMVEAMREEISSADFEEEMADTAIFFADHNHVRV